MKHTLKHLIAGSVLSLACLGSLQADRGKELFMVNCITCHGADGKGQTDVGKVLKARDLTSEPFKQGTSIEQVSNTILKGVTGTGMAGFPYLNKADRDHLAKYVLSIHKVAAPVAKSPAPAKKETPKVSTLAPAPKPVAAAPKPTPAPTPAPKPVAATPKPAPTPAPAAASTGGGDSEMIKKGRQLYKANGCNSCHGDDLLAGTPTGIAMKARNLVKDPYKQGDNVEGIMGTLKKGVPGTLMVAFPQIGEADSKAIASFISAVRKGEAEATDGAAVAAPTGPANKVSISYAMSLVAQGTKTAKTISYASDSFGAKVYAENCASCHGSNGQGNIAAKMISPAPYYRVRTQPLLGHGGYWISDKEAFAKLITEGLPGRLMPGIGTLTKKEIDALHDYMKECYVKQ